MGDDVDSEVDRGERSVGIHVQSRAQVHRIY